MAGISPCCHSTGLCDDLYNFQFRHRLYARAVQSWFLRAAPASNGNRRCRPSPPALALSGSKRACRQRRSSRLQSEVGMICVDWVACVVLGAGFLGLGASELVGAQAAAVAISFGAGLAVGVFGLPSPLPRLWGPERRLRLGVSRSGLGRPRCLSGDLRVGCGRRRLSLRLRIGRGGLRARFSIGSGVDDSWLAHDDRVLQQGGALGLRAKAREEHRIGQIGGPRRRLRPPWPAVCGAGRTSRHAGSAAQRLSAVSYRRCRAKALATTVYRVEAPLQHLRCFHGAHLRGGAPKTTAIRRRPSRVAEATRIEAGGADEAGFHRRFELGKKPYITSGFEASVEIMRGVLCVFRVMSNAPR